jgi:hypothetical protein
VDGAPDVADHRAPQPDLLDRALHRPELDDVALEELALGEDQDPHQVVEDDALAGDGQRGQDQPETRQHRPQVEHPEDHEDQRDTDGEAQDLGEQVLERGDPTIGLLGQRGVAGELGLLGVHDANQHAMDGRARPAVHDEQDDRGDEQRQRVVGEPGGEALRIDRGEGHGAIIPRRNRSVSRRRATARRARR